MAKALAPKLAVTLDDGQEYTIQTDNRDLVRFDITRGRMKWPPMNHAPMLWVTFLAWSCLHREGKLGANVEKELDRILGVDILDEDGNPVDLDDPDVVDAMSVDPMGLTT